MDEETVGATARRARVLLVRAQAALAESALAYAGSRRRQDATTRPSGSTAAASSGPVPGSSPLTSWR